jgi:hypothetical protein
VVVLGVQAAAGGARSRIPCRGSARWLSAAGQRVESVIFEGLKCKITATDVRTYRRIAILFVEIR